MPHRAANGTDLLLLLLLCRVVVVVCALLCFAGPKQAAPHLAALGWLHDELALLPTDTFDSETLTRVVAAVAGRAGIATNKLLPAVRWALTGTRSGSVCLRRGHRGTSAAVH